MFLYRREINDAMHSKLNVATMVVENEIEELKSKAQIAAFAMAGSQDLIEAVIRDDREMILYITSALQIMAQVDYCTIVDANGTVLTRTHAPENSGDSLAHLPHVIQALLGNSTAYTAQGNVVQLGTYAGAPIYDHEMNIIGVVSLGFRLDSQEFVYKLKEITACDITVFLNDIRISTTIFDEEGLYAIGTKASPEITEIVMSGQIYTGLIHLFGRNILTRYIPLFGVDATIVGMMFVGFDTAEDDAKMTIFITSGALIMFVVLFVCLALAIFISRIIEGQLERSMQKAENAQFTSAAMFSSSPQSNILFDSNFKIIDCNPAALKMMGFETKQEMLAGFSDRLRAGIPEVQPDGRRSLSLEEWAEKAVIDGHVRFETQLTITGRKMTLRVEFRKIPYEGNFAIVVYVYDMTDIYERETELKESQKVITEANENLRKARDEAEAANRSKTIFLANMSHEIRTPMNSIIGFSELAQDDDVPAKTRQYLSNISDNSKWLLNIINDILDNTKIESGKIILENIPFDMEDVIAQCQSAILPKVIDKGFRLYCYSEPLNGKKVIGDPVKLRQVLMNLLSNAVKFTSTGSVKILASIKSADENKATFNFEVKDTGIGMSPEHIENIFVPYMQADDTVTRRFGGTGLGLPISKSIVELMGGELSVESSLNVGSRFSFDLTFDLIDDTQYNPPEKIIFKGKDKPYFKGDILVCEDNGLNQQVICDHLARVGINAVVANNGQEGLEAVWEKMDSSSNKNPFDLIFMDIHMPVMDGLEAASKIKTMGIETPIVAMTANIMSNDLELYRENGIQDYLGKPFTSQDLWKCLMKYLPVSNYVPVDIRKEAEEEDKSLKQLRIYFAESNKTTYQKITDALDSGEIKLAHRLIHTLKSNAGQIGEKRLQEAAADAEHMLSGGENKLTAEHLNLLKSELDPVLKKLEPLRTINEIKDDKIKANSDECNEIIAQLEPILSKQSTECMNMLDDIRRIPGADDLVKYVEDFEFKKAILELAALKERLETDNGK